MKRNSNILNKNVPFSKFLFHFFQISYFIQYNKMISSGYTYILLSIKKKNPVFYKKKNLTEEPELVGVPTFIIEKKK